MNRQLFVRRCALAAVTAAALSVSSIAAAAQDRTGSAIVAPTTAAPLVEASAVTPSPRVGPVATQAGIVRAEPTTDVMHLQTSGRDNRNIIWMVVGGGMILAGSLIGDDVGTIVSVTGLVIGLVGVYRYLR